MKEPNKRDGGDSHSDCCAGCSCCTFTESGDALRCCCGYEFRFIVDGGSRGSGVSVGSCGGGGSGGSYGGGSGGSCGGGGGSCGGGGD